MRALRFTARRSENGRRDQVHLHHYSHWGWIAIITPLTHIEPQAWAAGLLCPRRRGAARSNHHFAPSRNGLRSLLKGLALTLTDPNAAPTRLIFVQRG